LVQPVLLDKELKDMIETVEKWYPVIDVTSWKGPANREGRDELRQTMKRDSERLIYEV